MSGRLGLRVDGRFDSSLLFLLLLRQSFSLRLELGKTLGFSSGVFRIGKLRFGVGHNLSSLGGFLLRLGDFLHLLVFLGVQIVKGGIERFLALALQLDFVCLRLLDGIEIMEIVDELVKVLGFEQDRKQTDAARLVLAREHFAEMLSALLNLRLSVHNPFDSSINLSLQAFGLLLQLRMLLADLGQTLFRLLERSLSIGNIIRPRLGRGHGYERRCCQHTGQQQRGYVLYVPDENYFPRWTELALSAPCSRRESCPSEGRRERRLRRWTSKKQP